MLLLGIGETRTRIGCITAAVVSTMLALRCTETPSLDEHALEHTRSALAPELYWYYEIMGQLEATEVRDGVVEGTYTERGASIPFTVERSGIDDPRSRTEGYRRGIRTMLAYMEPGRIPENEENRRFLRDLRLKLVAVTGEDFSDLRGWREWFDASSERLTWSADEGRLVVSEAPEAATDREGLPETDEAERKRVTRA